MSPISVNSRHSVGFFVRQNRAGSLGQMKNRTKCHCVSKTMELIADLFTRKFVRRGVKELTKNFRPLFAD